MLTKNLVEKRQAFGQDIFEMGGESGFKPILKKLGTL
jgi:hypothetical protein